MSVKPVDSSSLMAMRAAILERNTALQRAAGGAAEGAPQAGGFGDAMRSALTEVNKMQANSSAVSEAYELGATTDIAAVMLARQQASIGFEATMQVRNKLLGAYKDIMSMPV